MTDEALLERALRLAERYSADGRHGPFGAVVARNGEVVGEGWNGVVAQCDPTAHAEVQAIRRAAEALGTHVLEDCTIYSSCEPCPMCLGAIYWSRIRRVVFAATAGDARAAGFDDADFYAELGRSWTERRVRGEQLLGDRGREVLERWARNPRRVAY